jgi:2-oxoisovalerate dehydrogenase E2 component (dihydrolipoyl transacylase)
MPELKQFKLPDVGEGLTEAEIVKWHVRPGDPITVNQIIVEIETAKAVVELPSPYQGVVSALLVPEGATTDVGTPIISVQVGDAAGGSGPSGAGPSESGPSGSGPSGSGPSGSGVSPGGRDPGGRVPGGTAPPQVSTVPDVISSPPVEGAVEPGIHGSPAPKAERQAVLVGYGVKLGAATRRPRKAVPTQAAHAVPQPVAPAAPPVLPARPIMPANGMPGRIPVLAKPPVRKLAKDLGVDLTLLTGTCPAGSITRDDVHAAASSPALGGLQAASAAPVAVAVAVAHPQQGPREERIAIRGVRKHTAAAVASSAFTAPHVSEFLQIDMTETMMATTRLRSLPDFDGLRVSPLLLVAKALLIAAARHPMINSSWDEAAQEIVVKRYVNLGIAASTARGLVVPNIKDAQALSLPELARAINDLADAARAGKTTVADMQGGTITITNVGIFGVDAGTPILTPGEAGILAFGQVRDAPWVHEGQLAIRQVCTLSLSFDHRIIDGDLGSAVLRDVGAMLTDPLRMLAWS